MKLHWMNPFVFRFSLKDRHQPPHFYPQKQDKYKKILVNQVEFIFPLQTVLGRFERISKGGSPKPEARGCCRVRAEYCFKGGPDVSAFSNSLLVSCSEIMLSADSPEAIVSSICMSRDRNRELVSSWLTGGASCNAPFAAAETDEELPLAAPRPGR